MIGSLSGRPRRRSSALVTPRTVREKRWPETSRLAGTTPATAVAMAAKTEMRAEIRMVYGWVEKSVGLKSEWGASGEGKERSEEDRWGDKGSINYRSFMIIHPPLGGCRARMYESYGTHPLLNMFRFRCRVRTLKTPLAAAPPESYRGIGRRARCVDGW
jgi:hypothetical protein